MAPVSGGSLAASAGYEGNNPGCHRPRQWQDRLGLSATVRAASSRDATAPARVRVRSLRPHPGDARPRRPPASGRDRAQWCEWPWVRSEAEGRLMEARALACSPWRSRTPLDPTSSHASEGQATPRLRNWKSSTTKRR